MRPFCGKWAKKEEKYMKNPSNFEKKHHFFKQLFLQNLFGKMVFLKMEGFAWQIICALKQLSIC
ncbi:MAG TPA: hypothetical protein DDY31_08125 [Lachnospiraceae bacterium]|nr:hypothetical protein [Lachnospiraceae bacterium]